MMTMNFMISINLNYWIKSNMTACRKKLSDGSFKWKQELNKNSTTDQWLNCSKIFPRQSKLCFVKWLLLCPLFHQTDNGDSWTNERMALSRISPRVRVSVSVSIVLGSATEGGGVPGSYGRENLITRVLPSAAAERRESPPETEQTAENCHHHRHQPTPRAIVHLSSAHSTHRTAAPHW